jgi:hypothetical protein
VVCEIGKQRVHSLESRRIDHRSAFALDGHEACIAQTVEVKGQCAWQQPQARGNVASGHSLRACLDQQPKYIETIVLRQCGQGCDGIDLFHISMKAEIKPDVNRYFITT